MEAFVLKALSYGVLGLCAVMLVASWRILVGEQRRAGQPRERILRFTFAFMGFCAFLAILGSYVQLQEGTSERRLRDMRYKLSDIHNALCQKGFLEVKEVQRRSPGTDTQELEYIIEGIQRNVEDAWALTDTKEKLEPCR
jgi:hypothetical protein